jgi:Flp pilus assembly protein TadD
MIAYQPFRLTIRAAVLAIAVSGGLAGCANFPGAKPDEIVTGSIPMSEAQIAAAATAWGKAYDSNPKDRTTIINYAAALRQNGQSEQAVAVLRRGVVLFPKDQGIAGAYGKALAANGDFDQALRVIRGAQQDDRPDWRLYSTEGAILDQLGQTAEARLRYAKALQIAPGEPSVLNNFGLSYLLAGELTEAEKLLRQAAQSPKATSRIRQNLALALGLQGRFAEAEAVAKMEMEPQQAAANAAYLKSMMAQVNSWKQIQADGKTPPSG